jgi:amino acid adenylation domain-containing protein
MSLREIYQSLSSLSPEQRALFARRLEQSGWGRQATEIVPRPPGGGPIPVSLMQQRLWLMDQMEPDNPMYNLPLIGYELIGAVDPAALERSFQEVDRRHESLRTVFAESASGDPVQVVQPYTPRTLPVVDLTALPAGCSPDVGWDLAVVESRRPFDLARGPLWRYLLVRLEAERWYLLVGIHHIVADAWSLGVFFRELMQLYSAYTHGRPSPLPELTIQYPDFSLWQRQRLQGELLEEELRFWKEQLAGAPELIELPLDRPRPAHRGFHGRRIAMDMPPELPQALAAASLTTSSSLYMVLLSALKALLHRYSGQTDIVVGAPVAGRNNRGTEDLIGFFVNTIVFRDDLGGDPTFAELIRRVRGTVLDVFEHQELPFDRIVEAVQPRRDASYGPLYQTVFSLQNTAIPRLELDRLQVNSYYVDNGTSQTDLVMFGGMSEGLLGILLFEFNTEILDESTMQRLQRHFVTLLSEGVADSSRRLSELPLLSPVDRHQLTREWNDATPGLPTGESVDLPGTVDRWFERHAAANPDGLAVAAGNVRWTYGELERRANRIAHRLQSYGAGPGLHVALCLDRSPDVVAAALGALKAGAAYLPLDPKSPEERLMRTLDDATAPIVVTRRAWADLFYGRIGTLTVVLDAEAESIAAEPDWTPERPTGPRDLAYVIYTSGSTGVPKGVEVEHASLLNLMRWGHARFGLGPADHMTLTSSMAFDASVWEMWLALSAGAALHIPPEDILLSPPDLTRWMERERITFSFLATPLAREILALDESAPLPAGLALRTLALGGDRCPDLPEGLPFEIFNLYGPTESTVIATATRLAPGEPISIGLPIDGAEVHLLDRKLQPVPLGGAGEMYIGGRCLSRGYGARPDLTADRFSPDPFAADLPGARLYRTGDRGRRLADGRIDFLGRADHQVKLRGFRIELGEIESALRGHERVGEAAVMMRELAPGDAGLAAYFVPHHVVGDGGGPEPRELRAYLETLLPEYMVPAVFVKLEEMPRTPAGKIDRRALPQPGTEGLGGPYVAPSTPAEEALAELWREVLGVERVGATDDFFALGGHSLLAVRLIARLRERFPIDLSTRLVFQTPTLAGMSKAVETMTAAAAAKPDTVRNAEPALVALPRTGRRPG